MTKTTPTTSDDKPQLYKIKEAARHLECDDDDQRFKERLGRLAKARPTPAKIDQDEKG